MTLILHIAIPCPLQTIFDYVLVDAQTSPAKGMRALVPFGCRRVVGFVVGVSPAVSAEQIQQLKPVERMLDEQVLIPKTTFEIIQWASRYYHHPLGECLQTALPKNLRHCEPAQLLSESYWCLAKEITGFKAGEKQQRIIAYLQQRPGGAPQQQINQQFGSCRSSLLGLERKKIIIRRQRAKQTAVHCKIKPSHTLLKQQQNIVDMVCLEKDKFTAFLLHGITGSGKTEVYIQLTKKIVAAGKQVIILIPEIGLTTQFVERFRQQLSATIVVFNSAVADGARKQAWLLAREGLADVVIGTRSAVFTPLKELGLIIIDEEHDDSYKQQSGLRYHAKTIALMRAKKGAIPIVLGSATPSLESLYNVKQQRYKLVSLAKRATGAALPKTRVVDSGGPSAKSGISSILYKAIQKQIKLGNQVLLFINRRGFAPILMCYDCGWQAKCTSCDAKMVVHQSRNIVMCHHCGLIHRLLKYCPICKTTELKTHGVGTQQLEQTLQNYFADTAVIRIDRDSTQKVNAFADIINEIKRGDSKILVGTQMLVKGHDFHNVTLVGVLNADQGLFSADFRATETLAQLITQVVGRAGRGDKAGEVFIQTNHPKNEFWRDLIGRDYNHVAQKILEQRKLMAMPPFGSLCVIRAAEKQQQLAMDFLNDVLILLNQHNAQHVMVLGPVSATMKKRAGRYHAQLLLSSQQRKPLHQLLDDTAEAISKLKLARKVRWSIDIDPVDLM